MPDVRLPERIRKDKRHTPRSRLTALGYVSIIAAFPAAPSFRSNAPTSGAARTAG